MVGLLSSFVKLICRSLNSCKMASSDPGLSFSMKQTTLVLSVPVGAVRKVPVVTDDGLGVGRRMMLTLSCDHRVMDGAMGARFLQDVKRLLEEPLRLLV